jgi:hypothetical protein
LFLHTTPPLNNNNKKNKQTKDCAAGYAARGTTKTPKDKAGVDASNKKAKVCSKCPTGFVAPQAPLGAASCTRCANGTVPNADSSACVTPACVPATTCTSGAQCSTEPNGCGGSVLCGTW